MGDIPEEFKCVFPTWEYIYDLCREVSQQVKRDSFEPDVVVALARGGWFAGRCACDFLGLDDLTSLKMEHYVGTAERGDEATVRYPMPEGSVAGKNVLVIDDIAETGKSIDRAREYVLDREPEAVRTALLQLLPECDFEPDYVGEELENWSWNVYPWNFVEDMLELVTGVMERADQEAFTIADLRHYLYRHHGVERISMEIAQPNRMGEIMVELERQSLVEPVDEGTWRLAD